MIFGAILELKNHVKMNKNNILRPLGDEHGNCFEFGIDFEVPRGHFLRFWRPLGSNFEAFGVKNCGLGAAWSSYFSNFASLFMLRSFTR